MEGNLSMEFPIQTHIGAGPLRFGMTRDQVETVMGAKPRRFRRAPGSTESDQFVGAGVLVYYDAEGRCEAIEMTAEAAPTMDGRALVGLPFQELLDWARGVDPDLETDGAGLTSRRLGVALYAPSARKQPRDPVEAAMAFRPGYYDD
jgi:hypothetical protein